MGNLCSGGFQHEITVVTGDRQGAGTDANIYMQMYDDRGSASKEFKLDNVFKDDFERATKNVFKGPVLASFGRVDEIELWRDSFGSGDSWYCEVILIKDTRNSNVYYFPMERWVKADVHYIVQLYNTLPSQFDKTPQMRLDDMQLMREKFILHEKYPGFPPVLRNVPDNETDRKVPIQDRVEKIINKNSLTKYLTGEWRSLSKVKKMFGSTDLPSPKGLSMYDDDLWFAAQRLVGCNASMIKICNEIPENLPITNEMVRNVLGRELTIENLIEQDKLFIVDYKILKDLPTIDMRTLVAPIGLFYVDSKMMLKPLAIQLQQRPSAENPIFLPSDSSFTWLLAKMWFGNADAMVHIAIKYLGLCYLLLEGVTVVTKRHLAVNHPVHRMLKPFLEEVLATNEAILPYLLKEDGWLDICTQLGRRGATQLIERVKSIWRIDDHGFLPTDLESRGVLNSEILQHYPYRDDGLEIFNAISDFVDQVILQYYPDDDMVPDDQELQDWGRELSKSLDQGGLGIKGLPNSGHLMNADDVARLCTSLISMCTIEHTAVTAPMYDQYGYPVNCPTRIDTEPPCDKKARLQTDILEALPDRPITLLTASVSRLLSRGGRRGFGLWPPGEYVPEHVEAKNQFQRALGRISREVQEKNEKRPNLYKSVVFDPANMSNSIGNMLSPSKVSR